MSNFFLGGKLCRGETVLQNNPNNSNLKMWTRWPLEAPSCWNYSVFLCCCCLYSVLQDGVLVLKFSRLCAGQWCSLPSWGGGGGVRQRRRIQRCVTAHTGCVTVRLECWSFTPHLLSVATPNLPKLYCHTTDNVKIGTGKLQRMFLIISSAFFQYDKHVQYLFYSFYYFFTLNCVTVLTATTISSPQAQELRH